MNILKYKNNVFSQAGQDGILEYIFKTINIKNGNFIEFGAWDGIKFSNCRKLYKEKWSGTFIEPIDVRFQTLKSNYKKDSNIRCIKGFITSNNFAEVYNSDKPIDFMSIDVDGTDLEIFEGIPDNLLPTVACIEGGMGPYIYEERVDPNKTSNLGQSLSVIKESIEKRGYKILCSYQDVMIIKKEFFHLFPVSENLENIYIEGYLSSPLSFIPMYYKRLSDVGRKNDILFNILKKTNYFTKDYGTGKRVWKNWAIQNKNEITKLLKDYMK